MRYLGNVLTIVGMTLVGLATFFAILSVVTPPMPDTGESVMTLTVVVAGLGIAFLGILLRRN
jgi:LPXTG-motif cell wall-anchored protein